VAHEQYLTTVEERALHTTSAALDDERAGPEDPVANTVDQATERVPHLQSLTAKLAAIIKRTFT
jgi:hypothetical protein